jgi:alkanesulfonate monooxygenase SsuD/methylene tetrahydromethanopterin reductase-like flavin-dependent oxidoreductase (luciferase family)
MARLVEERGFEALFFAEHTHIPGSDRPLAENGEDLARRYWHTYDLFVAMTAAAAATSRRRLEPAGNGQPRHQPQGADGRDG